jgi:hypothetical protein
MKLESAGRRHRGGRFGSSSSHRRKLSKKASPSIGFTRPLLRVRVEKGRLGFLG